jgi:hypothetical protein
MAAIKKPGRGGSNLQIRNVAPKVAASSKIYEFAQRIYDKSGGATEELRRVHAAYIQNQKKV